MKQYICPFCLEQHGNKVEECPIVKDPESNKQMQIPTAYIKQYEDAPPFWLTTLGFSGHGKSTYLAMLLLLLEKLTGVMGEGFNYRTLGNYTAQKIQKEVRTIEIKGDLPQKTTPSTFIPPMLMQVFNVPESGSQCLVMYDVAGEIFNNRDNLDHWLPAIKQVRTIWFMVSLNDLRKESQKVYRINDLFNSYIDGMEKIGANLDGRNVIVVYTKADLIEDLPEGIRQYYNGEGAYPDPLRNLLQRNTFSDFSTSSRPEPLNIKSYWKKMDEISQELENYTFGLLDEGGPAFISSVKAKKMNLVFSITSSLGQDPGGNAGNVIIGTPDPRRVMDPFFWAIRLNTPPKKRNLFLVLDAGSGAEMIYEENRITKLTDALKKIVDVTVYNLGHSRPVRYRNQSTPSAPPVNRLPSLIGPILNKIENDSNVVIISNNFVLDLDDYAHTPWRENLVLVNIGENNRQPWPRKFVYRPDHDNSDLVDYIENTLNLGE